MQNLKSVHHSVLHPESNGLPLTATAWDTSTNTLICTFGPSPEKAFIELKRIDEHGQGDQKIKSITSWDAPCPLPDLSCDHVLSLQYLVDTGTTCIVLAGGDIVVVREDPLPGENLIEIVGSVDSGIAAAIWSPDEELLAISTRADTLLYMTRDFENIASISYTPDDLNVSSHVSVGWGKKETQFKGRGQNQLRDPTVPEKVDEGVLSDFDDGNVTMSWRGDGAFLAVNKIEDSKRRIIRVFSRDGSLDSVAEPVDGLESALAWRPAGNLIASVQRRGQKIDVVFFERNGLRHGEFSLRSMGPDSEYRGNVQLAWNTDSSVLAVLLQDRVQYWTMGNYHYYLKQENTLDATSTQDSQPKLVWHPQKALEAVAHTEELLHRMGHIFTIAGGTVCQPSDRGAVAVIDGETIKYTPLRHANVPPPMALHEIQLSGSVAIDVAFSSSGANIAVLQHGFLSIYQTNTKKPIEEPSLVTRWDTSHWKSGVARQVVYVGEAEVYVLLSSRTGNADSVYRFDPKEKQDCSLNIKIPGDRKISMISTDTDSTDLLLGLSDGTVLQVDMQPGDSIEDHIETEVATVAKFPSMPLSIEVVKHEGKMMTFGLIGSGNLLVYEQDTSMKTSRAKPAERLLAKSCTSMMATPSHVLFTTTQHLLKFAHLNAIHEIEVPADEPEKDERCRSIERGARLVTVIPTAYSVVLQMPRGNLETVFPRALVLAGIRKSINEKDYKTAFLACRTHRVDMNILHDHAPRQFMDNVPLFINQVKKKEHIDLFLSQLREDDVSKTLYRETLKKSETSGIDQEVSDQHLSIDADANDTSKVNSVCDAFLSSLSSKVDAHIQNIITAHVCKSPPDLDSGLLVVGKLRKGSDSEAFVEKAAEHICFLADVNQLYDHALGLYDLDLALLIAQQSQKDPREYLPYLQSLQELPTPRRGFTIDDHLKRYSKALKHLHELSAFDELKDYVEKHTLYTEALELYRYSETQYNAVLALHAAYLARTNRTHEAALAYDYLRDFEAASTNYRLAHDWSECLTAASLVPLPPDQLRSLASGLVDDMLESKEYQAAATITLEYLSDLEGSVRLMCRGHDYIRAARTAILQGRAELLESVLDPCLGEGLGTLTELLAEMKGQLLAQVPRLRELRVKKHSDPLSFFGEGGGGADGVDIPDNVSLAPSDASTSGRTFMTRYTNAGTGTVATGTSRRSSKNRRREERKRARGKKGSVYEEEYLLASLVRLAKRLNESRRDVRACVEGLVRRGMKERARAMDGAMVETVDLAAKAMGEVMKEGPKGDSMPRAVTGLVDPVEGGDTRPGGGDGVVWDSLHATRKIETVEVESWNRLAILP